MLNVRVNCNPFVLPKTYNAKERGVSRDLINKDALCVIDRLQEAGHTAYLVGGGVRDILVGLKPKDFDISTSAKPEEIKELFRRQCLLIGRRFRLAHIRFGSHILEVSTFRSGDNDDTDLIVRDNTWGSPEEDVLRRDFTINGLFYDPSAETIIDYVDGCEDLKQNLLRTIGEPSKRFIQDPVRMIRMLKFRARFGFDVDPEAQKSLRNCSQELVKSSPARLLEEVFRMLESGSAEPFFQLMQDNDLLGLLFPWLAEFLSGEYREEVLTFLRAADRLNKGENTEPLSRPVLACCLIFPIFQREITAFYERSGRIPNIQQIADLSASMLHEILEDSFTPIPRRIRTTIQYILHTQYRLTPLEPTKTRSQRLARNKEFPDAYQFLKVRAAVNSKFQSVCDEWAGLVIPHRPHRARPTRRRSRRPRT